MRIAVIGTGSMGSALAETLIDEGHELIVHNRTPAKTEKLKALGAAVASSAAEAIWCAEVTLLVLADINSLRDTLLSEAMRPMLAGRKLVSVTTTSADDIMTLGAALKPYGVSLAEVTVTVYPDVVKSKKGQYILGCSEADEPMWRSIFEPIGDAVYRAGELGNASRADLAFVMAFVFNVMATAHAAAVSTTLGLPQDLISHQLIQSPTLSIQGASHLLPQMFSHRYALDTASIDGTVEALSMALKVLSETGMPTRVLREMLMLYQAAAAQGRGREDAACVYEVLLPTQSAHPTDSQPVHLQ